MFKSKAPLLIAITFILFFGCGSDSTDDSPSNTCNIPDYEIVDGLLIGDLSFDNQEQIDEFDWSCINSVSGTLRIGSNIPTLDPVVDISSLSVVESVGNLSIYSNEELVSLNGLQNISINPGGNLHIEFNESLVSLDGLDNLSTGLEVISIKENTSLISITALSNMTHSGYIYIDRNNALTSLLGLQNITFVSQVWITNNASLTNLIGIPSFDAITSLTSGQEKRVYIFNNDSLQTLEGVSGSVLDGRLFIIYHASLLTIEHLTGLSQTGRIDITHNELLSSLNGLEELTFVDGPFRIYNNVSLNDFCALSNLVSNGVISGEYTANQCAYNPTIEDLQAGNCSN